MLFYFVLRTHNANLQCTSSYYRWSPWFNWQCTLIEHLVTPPKRTLSSCFSPLVFQLVVKCDGCPSVRPTLSPKFSDQTRYWMFLLFSEVSEGGFWGKRRNEENWLVGCCSLGDELLFSHGKKRIIVFPFGASCIPISQEHLLKKKLWGINALIF